MSENAPCVSGKDVALLQLRRLLKALKLDEELSSALLKPGRVVMSRYPPAERESLEKCTFEP